jgi:hypothetical protein
VADTDKPKRPAPVYLRLIEGGTAKAEPAPKSGGGGDEGLRPTWCSDDQLAVALSIAAQNDPAGSAAERGLARAVAHFRALGKSVRVLRPPVFVKDFNELLQRENAG